MDTTYYTFQTRKIKASGGADLVTFVPTAQPAPQADELAHAGEVLNFDLCRRRLETRSAWKDLTAAARSVGVAEDPREEGEAETSPRHSIPARPRKRQSQARAPWVDILTSALALALVCLVGAAAMLSIV